MTDSTAPGPEAGGGFDNVPTAMVYDAFAKAAASLRAHYVRLSDEARSAHAPDVWWVKVLALRDIEQAVPSDDRDALIDHIKKWRRKLTALRTDGSG